MKAHLIFIHHRTDTKRIVRYTAKDNGFNVCVMNQKADGAILTYSTIAHAVSGFLQGQDRGIAPNEIMGDWAWKVDPLPKTDPA